MEREGYRTKWLQDAYLRGKAKGEAKWRTMEARRLLVRVLTKRGLAVTAKVRSRIEAEEDLQLLRHWHDVAITATSLSEVFAERERRGAAAR
jgi:hypothetical protein